MFYAICKSTGEKVNSITIEQDPKYQFINDEEFYADPDEIEDCPDNLDIKKIKVVFRKGKNIINWLGTEYYISPCFFIPNKSKLGINTIPESPEHKMAKNFIYDRIKKKNLEISYSKITKPEKYTLDENIFNLPIDYDKIGIEITTSRIGGLSSRRADVIMPFIVKHPILGNGVIIEIQFSKQYKRTKVSRELDWAIRGFSVAWIYRKDFEKINDIMIKLNSDKINVDSYANLIKENNKSHIRDLKFTTQSCVRQLEAEKQKLSEEVKKWTQEIVLEIVNDSGIMQKIQNGNNISQPVCGKCGALMTLKNGRNGKFWACPNFPRCKCTSVYIE